MRYTPSRHDHVGFMDYGPFEAVCAKERGGCGQTWDSVPVSPRGRRWVPKPPDGRDTVSELE